MTRSAVLVLSVLASASAYRVPPPRMGLFDGMKSAFSSSTGEKPIPSADRVTPFDRWLGLDKSLEQENEPDKNAIYIDPSDVNNYVSASLAKPMGIAFVENEGSSGVYIDEVLADGSAAVSQMLRKGDQLVAVDSTLVLGVDFDTALDAIKSSSGETTKLTFYRGPTTFLYGPTAASAEWYAETLLK